MAFRKCKYCNHAYDLNADGPFGYEHEDFCSEASTIVLVADRDINTPHQEDE